MRMKTFVLALLVIGTLNACSSKPDVGDVEGDMKAIWGECKGIKMSDLKKTNGIDRGQTYDIGISYKLEILSDSTWEEMFKTESICPQSVQPSLLRYVQQDGGSLEAPLKKGQVINVNQDYSMVKSEKGWMIQSVK